MVKKVSRAIKHKQLDSNFLHKSEKTKFGGAGEGGVFRDKRTGKDYLVKRVALGNITTNWRSWDELLASKILRIAGVGAPSMFAVTDSKGLVYVASKMIPNVQNCDAKAFKSLPKSVKDPVLASHLLHCWVGNRDLINISGENFVIDKDSRIFNVDLGAALFSGFRSVIPGQDSANFNEHQIQNLLLEHQSKAFGVLYTSSSATIEIKNKNQILAFFSDLFESPETEQSYALQGALTLAKFSDKDIKEIVSSTGHTPIDKENRIRVLIARRDALLTYMIKKYGPNSLEEEQLSLDLQRLFHRQKLFNPYHGKGGDAIVSYRSQYANAVKPRVRFDSEGSITLISEHRDAILDILTRLGILNTSLASQTINLTLPISKFKLVIHSEILANTLQAFFYSYGYEANKELRGKPFYTFAYKGDGSIGFRPEIKVNDGGVRISLPEVADKQQLVEQIASEFNIPSEAMTLMDSTLQINGFNLEQLTHTLMDNTGVRKTAVISENNEGQILAGKLDFAKKKDSGFATAGGGSDRPYNPALAAKEEGEDEFGHSIQKDVQLIPLGSTLPNSKRDNIYLVPPNKTNDKQNRHIGYKEFQDGSIKYYNFEEFRACYAKDRTKFDRTSVNLYLNYYQRELTKALTALGINHVIVQISQKPQSIGKIYLKPSIEQYDFSNPTKRIISNNDKLMGLLQRILPGGYQLTEKISQQGKHKFVNREIIVLSNKLNPAVFFQLINHSSKPDFVKEKPVVNKEHTPINAINSLPQFHQLINAIKKMSVYGKKLIKENEKKKGDLAIKLADELLDTLEAFYKKSHHTPISQEAINQFKQVFKEKLHEQDEQMEAHRKIWKPITANIFLAFTGIGFLALLGNMAYEAYKASKENKVPKFNQLFFFARTNTEKAATTIEKELNHIHDFG